MNLEQILKHVYYIHVAVEAFFRNKWREEGVGLTYTQYLVFDCLGNDTLTSTELMRQMRLHRTTGSRILPHLIAKGDLLLSYAPYDKRVKMFALTPQGKEKLRIAKQTWSVLNKRAQKEITSMTHLSDLKSILEWVKQEKEQTS